VESKEWLYFKIAFAAIELFTIKDWPFVNIQILFENR